MTISHSIYLIIFLNLQLIPTLNINVILYYIMIVNFLLSLLFIYLYYFIEHLLIQ